MSWDYPLTVNIDGEEFEIENNCDYRVVLDCMKVYEDPDIDVVHQHQLAMFIFYKEPLKIKNCEQAIKKMIQVIDVEYGEEETYFRQSKPLSEPPQRLISWSKDFKLIAPAVSRILGYNIRTPGKFTHWWTFMGAWNEVGECAWSTIVSIRKKKLKGENLEDWERKIYRDNKNDIDLPQLLSEEDNEWLFSDD